MSDGVLLYVLISAAFGIAAVAFGVPAVTEFCPWWLAVAVAVFLFVVFSVFWPVLMGMLAYQRWRDRRTV